MMTDEEIIAAAAAHIAEDWQPHYYYRNINLIDFAREIMKLERERCAKICDDLQKHPDYRGDPK